MIQESRYTTMATPKELFLELLKPEGKSPRQLLQYEALEFALPEPILLYMGANRRPGTTQ